jgi:glycolate oxidase iron-sulfur subunit
MQTTLSPEFLNTPEGVEAESILRKCVHCGFCTATCPTYQLLGDELDGPRGRIYLIKQTLEGAKPSEKTQQHLDKCLTCRNCETTCPSGVQYARLLDIGRGIVEKKVTRSFAQQGLRWLLRTALLSPYFGPALRLGQWVRPILPKILKAKVPRRIKERYLINKYPKIKTIKEPAQLHLTPGRKVLLLAGCVQPAMAPGINLSTARVLSAVGVHAFYAAGAGCCGALSHHLNAQQEALDQMRRNIDAWWPLINQGEVEALIMTASGCGVSVKEYGHLLAQDPQYALKAQEVAQRTFDLSEWFLKEQALLSDLRGKLDLDQIARTGLQAYHPPCTLQHGQQLKDTVQVLARGLGFKLALAEQEAHLCCGSAGTYSLLNPGIANALKERKLTHLTAMNPKGIVSANVGCITHLQSATQTPVRHWIEMVEECLGGA